MIIDDKIYFINAKIKKIWQNVAYYIFFFEILVIIDKLIGFNIFVKITFLLNYGFI